MLRWVHVITRVDRIKNKFIMGCVGVDSILDEMSKNKLDSLVVFQRQ